MTGFSNIWYGPPHVFEPRGKKYKDKFLVTKAIHCAGEPGSGWKFEVVTESDDINMVGEIITLVKPSDSSEYTASLFLPTLFSSGLNGSERINATRLEYLYYLQFIYNSRTMILANWNQLKISEEKQAELESSIDELRFAISGRRTRPIAEAWEVNPGLTDKRGRINPGAASAKYTAIATRLEKQIGRETRSEGSLQKRRRFATKLYASIEQDIWDMRNLHRLSPITIERELNRRIEKNIFKPMLFGGLYVKKMIELNNTSSLPRTIDVFTAEVQLMAIRNLVADIQKGINTKESFRILKVLLSVIPNEDLYIEFFTSLKIQIRELYLMIKQENEDYEKFCVEIKNSIRFRASDDVDHPWYIERASSK
jgi:hypothetical protein